MKRWWQGLGLGVLVLVGVLALPGTVSASHSWGGYHWARTSNPFTLKLGDNVVATWEAYLGTTATDWSLSSVLDALVVPGQAKGNCRGTKGRVEVCNKTYGANGWLGVAQIWVSGVHITQGTVKVNDTYFGTPTYNTPAWRNLVMCQEVGHTLGLDHQDEDFNNPPLGSCMDYTSDPTPNQHPNQHDYEQLEIIYAHLDAVTTLKQISLQAAMRGWEDLADNPRDWGQLVKSNGKIAIYERDLGGGQRLVTFVIWD